MSREFDIPENHVTVAGTEYMLLGSTFAAGGQASLYEAVAQNSDVNRRFLIKRFHNGGDYSEEFESEELSQKVAANVHQAILAAAFHDKKQLTSVMLKASSDCSTVQDFLIAWEDVPPEDPASDYYDMGRFLESIQIVKSLLGALSGIHKHGVLHMDISPSNIMWGKTEAHGTAYLLDFSCCTKIGSVVGERRRTTLSFSAPETQIPGEVLSPAADIYSVGAVFLLLVAGMAAASSKQSEKKWHPRKLPGKGNLNVTAPIGDLEIPDAYKGKLSEIIIKATTSVEKRYQSASEMLTDMVELERIIAGRGMTPETLIRGSAALFRKECDNENGIFHYKLHDDLVTETIDFNSKTPVDILTQNTILIGGGGSGKTTKIRTLWEKCLDEWKADPKNNPIPVFVPLNTFDSRKSNWDFFIRDYITEVYFPDLSENVKDRRADLLGLFNSTRIVLFLDGINEAVDSSMLNTEIAKLAAIKNVTVIITSRNDLGDAWSKTKELFSMAEMKPLNDDLIINCLHERGLESPSHRLLETLRRPMFLALYLQIKITDNSVKTAGQILYAYHQHLIDAYKAGCHEEAMTQLYVWELNDILPGVASAIDRMRFTTSNVIKAVQKIPIGEEHDFKLRIWGREQYSKYAPNITGQIPEEDLISAGKGSLAEKLIATMLSCGIVRATANKQEYTFCHQNYLDFYQTLCVLNQMESHAEGMCLPNTLSKGILSDSVMCFLGDILGEHEFRTKIDCTGNPSPVEVWLQRHCAERRGQEAQMTVRNLIEVMKWSRERRITANYSNLDLSLANFYDCFLPNALFANSVITESTFMRSGHRQEIDEIALIHSSNQLVTACFGEKDVCIWDIATGQIVQRITHNDNIISFDISSDEQLILITCRGKVTVYTLTNGEKVRDLEIYSFAASMAYHNRHELVRFCSDGRTILCSCGTEGEDCVRLWDIYTGESKPIIKLSEGYKKAPNIQSQCCTISTDRKTLYAVSNQGDIAVWSLENRKCQNRFYAPFKTESIAVTPDETYAILLSDDCAVYGLNLLTGEIDQVCSNIGNDSNGRIQERKLITATNQYVIWAGNRTLGGYAFKEKEHLSFWTPQISALCVDKAGARLFFSDDDRRIRIGSIPEKRIISSFEWGKYINWSEPHPIVPHIYDTGIARITRDRHIIQCIQKDNAFAFGNKNCCNYFDANYHICLEANSEGDDHLVLRDLRTSAIIDSIPDDLFCIAYDEKGEEIFATRSDFRWAKYFDTEHKLVVNYWAGLTKIWDLQTHQWTSVGDWSEEVSHILSYCSEDEWDVMRDALIGTSERCFTMGSHVVFGTYDGRIQVWDLSANKITDTAAHSTGIARIYPVPGETYFISEGNDKSRCIWNIQTLERSNCDMHRSLINKDNIIGALAIDEAAASGINLLESAEPKSTDEDLIIHYECIGQIILLACCEKNLSASKCMVSGSGNLVVFYDDPDPSPEAAKKSYNSYIRIYDTRTRMRLHNYDLFLSQSSALDDTYIEFTNYAINISLHERTNKLAVAFADGSVLVYDLSQKIPFAHFTWGVIGASDVSHCSFSGVIMSKRLAELLTQNGATF